MTSAPQPLALPIRSSWRVSRDGVAVAAVALRHEGSGVVVAADLAATPAGTRPHCFETLQAAEAFVSDLIASFTCLGCDVSAA